MYIEKKALRVIGTNDNPDEELTNEEILKKLLTNFGLILRQVDNAFKLYQLSALKVPSAVNEFVYDPAGTFVSSSTVDLTTSLDAQTLSIPQGNYQHNTALKEIKSVFNHRTKVAGIDFDSKITLFSSSQSFSQFFISDGVQTISLSGTIDSFFTDQVSGEYAEYELKAGGYWWNNSTGSWQGTQYFNNVTLSGIYYPVREETVSDNSFSITTTETPIDADGQLEVIIHQGNSDQRSAYKTEWSGLALTIKNNIATSDSAKIEYKLTQAGNFSKRVEYPETWFGDGVTNYSVSAIRFSSADADTTSEDWQRRGDTLDGYRNFHHNLLAELLDVQRNNYKNRQAELIGGYSPANLLVENGMNLFFLGGEFTAAEERTSGYFIDLQITTSATDIFDDIIYQSDLEQGTTTSSSGSTGSTITDWEDITNKPFDTFGDGIAVTSAVAALDLTYTDARYSQDNFYLSGLSFSSSTGELTATMSGVTDHVVNLDGRYALGSHNHDGAYDFYGQWEIRDENDLAGAGADIVSGGSVRFIGGTGITTSRAGNDITITNDVVNTNYYLSGLSFSSATGELTATMSGQSDIIVNLDGRYALGSHDHSGSYDFYGHWELRDNDELIGNGANIVAGASVQFKGGAGITTSRVGNEITIATTITDTNNYLSGLSFSSSTGELTATRSGLNDIVVDLDGRYALGSHDHSGSYDFYGHWELRDENDLAGNGSNIVAGGSVQFIGGTGITTSRAGNTITITNDVVNTNYYLSGLSFSSATGDLTATVSGATNQVVNLDGRYALGNHDHSGSYDFYGSWELRDDNDLVGAGANIVAGGSVKFRAGTGITTSRSGNELTIATTVTDTNYYLSGLSFDTGTGVLTATVSGATNRTVDLDGRYSLTSHTHTHFSSTSNPHSVTKAQVGLGNVPNTDTTNAANISSGTLSNDRLPDTVTAGTFKTDNGQYLRIEAGEMNLTGTAEYVYIGAEAGVMIYSSNSNTGTPDNSISLCAADTGASTFNDITAASVTVNGILTVPVNIWHQSSDSNARLYFASGSHTYIRSAGTGGDIVFRNGANATIGTIDQAGNITATDFILT